jgi:hypothetical protein
VGLKLNLGSGQNPRPGYVNVDLYGEPDVRLDLESFPWPWPDGSVSEIVLIHVLEHLGATPAVFIRIMQEMYRVCEPGARIEIVVPHPRHDHFIGDPTHVRPVTPEVLALFSRKANLEWRKIGASNSTLALYHGVDFEVVGADVVLDEPYAGDLRSGKVAQEDVALLLRRYNNVALEIRFTLQVVKT